MLSLGFNYITIKLEIQGSMFVDHLELKFDMELNPSSNNIVLIYCMYWIACLNYVLLLLRSRKIFRLGLRINVLITVIKVSIFLRKLWNLFSTIKAFDLFLNRSCV